MSPKTLLGMGPRGWLWHVLGPVTRPGAGSSSDGTPAGSELRYPRMRGRQSRGRASRISEAG